MDYLPFEFSDRWIKWKDVERCPFPFHHPGWLRWTRLDDQRLMLCALDNYADYLIEHAKAKNSNNPDWSAKS